ncbi:hypothetical protein [Streptomyces sp. NBC_00878]|uniref:hypothetical protein n=1 Tax=Streptomyces sp. NBC_00878 TaxID=2975854 RepID=UPI00225B6D49|nr:hypothetical protein [Streptomyces sp. NBC_00878]MCX4904477.1 hypothetical protein [Streptomyces sp. NBC_00878]
MNVTHAMVKGMAIAADRSSSASIPPGRLSVPAKINHKNKSLRDRLIRYSRGSKTRAHNDLRLEYWTVVIGDSATVVVGDSAGGTLPF